MIYKSQLRSRKGNEIRTTDIYLLISGTPKDWHTTPQMRQPPSLPSAVLSPVELDAFSAASAETVGAF
jgi:hypothetical protein